MFFHRARAHEHTAGARYVVLDRPDGQGHIGYVTITLDLDEQAVAGLPLQPGERERVMQIELACRFYARGWLSFGQGTRMAGLDHFAFGVALAERNIPRQYGLTEAQEDLAHACRQ